MQYFKTEKIGKVELVTFTNPPVNVMQDEVIIELDAFIDELAADKDVRAVVLTGEGKAFCAGANIKGFFELLEKKKEDVGGRRVYTKLENLEKPVIAAVNGVALGGGCELAMACHIRFASEKAKFALPEVGLGIIPGWGGTQRLPRIVGKAKALDLILNSKMISAQEAKDLGIVLDVFSPETLVDEAVAYAAVLAEKAPIAVKAALRAVMQGMEVSLEEGLEIESQGTEEVFNTKDAFEGATAFVEKRKAVFKGE